MSRLIINADDFGLTSGVNRAIVEASRAGAVTSTTLMANSAAFDEAVALAKSQPQLRVGCHIVLIDGEPITSGLKTLTSGTAKFKTSLKEFALAAARKKLSQDEIRCEAEAQIRKIQSAGIVVSHLDTHKHTHIFPHVLHPVLQAARSCRVRAVRNPFEPATLWPQGSIVRTPALWMRALQVKLLYRYSLEFNEAVNNEQMKTTKGTAGIIATGCLNQELLTATLQALPEGDWEFVCHPGYLDSDLRSAGTRLLQSRMTELQALTSQETRQVLVQRGIKLISYEDLQQS
ncbi:MAG TPA: ChbG/HpnK family deacetylase [Candidatus Angelobacter sp.]|nr:ChbG/HpnK family deacetylase [Candidatus Angelobacter sp.]